MSSAILLAKILLLLMNVMRVQDLGKQGLQCHWVCDVNYKEVVGTREQIGASFKFSKRVHQNCTDDRTVDSWDFITVGIIVALDVVNPSEYSFSDFLTLSIEHVSPRQFLFGNENTDLESVNSSVSCLLQPTSNETGRISSNGLDAIYSPLFYLRNSVRNSQKTPYLGYAEVGGRFHLSAGFTNSVSPVYRLEFDQSDLTRVRIWSVLFLVLFLLRIPSLLTLFCATDKTVQIERLSGGSFKEPGEDLCSEAIRGPIRQEDSIELVVSPAAPNRDAGKEVLSSRVATEHGEVKDFPCWANEDLELGSSTAGISTRFPNQENNSSDGHSEMVGLRGHAAKGKNPPVTLPEFSQTHSGGTRDYRASGSSSAMGEFERNKPQTGVQHAKIQNRKLDSVLVMDAGAPASPVGLRSFITNKVFSNSKSKSSFDKFLKFFILIMFPLFIPIIIDVFGLAIPRLFPRIASNLPSPFLVKSVFNFTYNVCPMLYLCLVNYIFRIGFFCFQQSSANWVPSFLCRKHFGCFPSIFWSACDECKKGPDLPKHCEIPVNIKSNDDYSLLEILKKNWKDVFQNIYPKYVRWLFSESEDESSCSVVRNLICFIVGGVLCILLVILFIALVILDIVASLSVTSLCYGRVWFTKDWSENQCTQLVYFIAEFCVICLSVMWIVYFLFCSFLSMAVALSSFYIAAVNYRVEIVSYLAINVMNCHIMWSCYSSFTDTYDGLLDELRSVCRKNHKSELDPYKEGIVHFIPKKLFTSACDKLKPEGNSMKNLSFHLIVWVVGLFFLLSFTMGSSTDKPIGKILASTVAFFVVVHPLVWDFLLTRGKYKIRLDNVFKDNIEDHVDAFFKGKLD